MSKPIEYAGPVVPRSDLHTTIARAAQATGTDFDYLLAQARLESSLDPSAQASTSSAAGLYQFTRGTWLNTLGRHGAEHGYGWAQQAIEHGAIASPAVRAQIMALRFDPQAASLMAGELAGDNRMALSQQLGRDPDATELYLAHFLGAAGAGKFLTALGDDPQASAAALFPEAAQANRGIFYGPGGARSLDGVMALMRGKVAGAMNASGGYVPSLDEPQSFTAPTGYVAAATRFSQASAAAAPTARPSMADTLASTFAMREGSPGAGHIRNAYGKLKAFGL